MRFTVEPSPAGGYHVRLLGSDAPLSHHDTEEEAETRRQAYERGAGEPRGELVDLPDGSEVLVRPVDQDALGAFDPRSGESLGVARYVRNPERPDSAEASVTVIDAWQGRGIGGELLRRLCRRATEDGVRTFTASLRTGNPSMLALFERLGTVKTRGLDGGVVEINVEVPVDEVAVLLRSAATGHVGRAGEPRH
jgi:RimJ/RimL family protein N-acetyltransferase